MIPKNDTEPALILQGREFGGVRRIWGQSVGGSVGD